jgi:hypothetical protein
MWSLPLKNLAILGEILFLSNHIMTLGMRNWSSRVDKLAFAAPRYCDSEFASYIFKVS